MKKLLLSLLLCTLALAQPRATGGLWPTDSLPIDLTNGYMDSIRTIADSTTYQKHILYHESTVIDFSLFTLKNKSECPYCKRCPQPGCHRNACQYAPQWYLQPTAAMQPLQGRSLALGADPLRPLLIDSDSAWAHLCLEQELNPGFVPNFETEAVVVASVFGDCHATYQSFFFRHGDELVWLVLTHYGGCRAARRVSLAYMVPRWPGMQLRMLEYNAD